jgi:uncharacterized protein (TIGR00251 family)
VRQAGGGVIIAVWAAPGARASEILGVEEGRLRIRVAAPPAAGRANAELRRFLAQRLDVPPTAVAVVAGGTSRHKRVAVAGISAGVAIARLGAP